MSMEILIRIEAPELSASINNLAVALSGNKIAIPDAKPEKAQKTETAKEKVKPTEDIKQETPVDEIQTDSPVETTEETEEKTYTLVQVRERLAELSREGKQAKVKALIEKFGASKLSEIKEEKYAAMMKEAEGL